MATSTRIGSVEVTAVLDYAPPPFPPDQFFPDVPAEAWVPHAAYALDSEGLFRTNFGVFVVRSDDFALIVDTGLGPGPHEGFGGGEGALLANLSAAGVEAADVTGVLNTHLHPDHVGWNVTGGAATFPGARYYVSRIDWEYWTAAAVADENPHIGASALPLESLGVLQLVDGDQEVAPGVRALATPGHTPGHISFLVESGGEAGVIVGDVIHSRAQVSEPDWCAGFDMDKPLARETRKALIERAVREKLTLAASHLVIDTNIGQVVEVENRRYWQAL